MTVRLYRSTDAGAPNLTGQVGSLVALLDAILVNGYGAKPAAGWTKAFSAANKGAYKQDTTASNNPAGMYLYVDDTGPGAGSAREARATGFETMSAITPTGTGQFPTAALTSVTGGYTCIRKSATADATVRQWTAIANGQTLYLFIESGDNVTPVGCTSFFWGDIKPYKAVDPYAVLHIGRVLENQTVARYEPFGMAGALTPSQGNLNTKFMGHFMPRKWTGLGGALQVGKTFDMQKWGGIGGLFPGWSADNQVIISANGSISKTMGRNADTNNPFPAPNGPDGSIWLSPMYVFHDFGMRGYMPGCWAPLHDRPLNHLDTFTVASGPLAGKSMIAINFMCYIGFALGDQDHGVICIEYSDTWT